MAGGPEDDITALARSSWRRVLSAARGMEVFVDRPCMESLHWTLGDAAAFQSGVMNVRPFPCPPSTLRVVTEAMFVLGSPLSTSGALRETLSSSGLHRCVIATAVSHGAHVEILGATAGPEAETNPHFVFKHLEEKIRGWLGFKDARVQVLHFPGLSFAPVIRGFLFTPAFSSMSPLLPSDLGPMNRSRPAKKRFRSLAELDVHALPSGFHKALCLLASTVEDVLGALAVREECFFVGPTARLAALKLANSARSRIRRKNALGRASVVFLDRSLDLAGAVAHHGDTLADRILDLLPRLPGGHTADVAVNIVALTSVVPGDWGPDVVVPGCVAQSQPAGRLALWESMMLSKQKEALMEVRRQLVEGAGKAGLPIRTSIGKVTADQLESYVRAFRSDWDLCVSHAGLLQLGLATVQALRCPLASHRDTLLGAEKLLLQSLRNGDIPKVLLQLCSRLQHSGGHDDFSPLDIILLLTYVYSLSGAEALNGGEEQELAEAELCKALFHALGDSCHLWDSLEAGTGEMPSAEEKDTWLRGLFVKLRGVAQAPSSLHRFRIYEQGDSTHQALYHPLIKQVLDEALSTEQAESSDLEHMTSGLTDLLKTGFGMFMKVTRPKPSDHPLIIIFVLGGVTPGEVKLVRDTLMTRKPSHQVILLSTRLLRPSDVPPLIFSDDRLDPIFDF